MRVVNVATTVSQWQPLLKIGKTSLIFRLTRDSRGGNENSWVLGAFAIGVLLILSLTLALVVVGINYAAANAALAEGKDREARFATALSAEARSLEAVQKAFTESGKEQQRLRTELAESHTREQQFSATLARSENLVQQFLVSFQPVPIDVVQAALGDNLVYVQEFTKDKDGKRGRINFYSPSPELKAVNTLQELKPGGSYWMQVKRPEVLKIGSIHIELEGGWTPDDTGGGWNPIAWCPAANVPR